MGCFSFCSPSRGETSTIFTKDGYLRTTSLLTNYGNGQKKKGNLVGVNELKKTRFQDSTEWGKCKQGKTDKNMQ